MAGGAAVVLRRKRAAGPGLVARRTDEGELPTAAAVQGLPEGENVPPIGEVLPKPKNSYLLRRAVLGGLGVPVTATGLRSARAEMVSVNETRCEDCAGEGYIQCLTCRGSGQLKMLGIREGSPEAQYQFVDCPDCDGIGTRLCPRCYGTGLPAKKLKGFLRDPVFKKVLYRLKRQKIDLDTLPKLKEEVKEAVEEAEKRMANAV